MSFEAFNSVGGFTVGIPPTPVINEEGIATLTGLQVAGISNLGSINNVILLGGEDGYYLQTNGEGGLTWAPANGGGGGNGVPGGSNSEVQFNSAGEFGGDAGFTYNNVTNQLSVSGNIVATNFVASGNSSATNFVANGNISGANLNVTRITATGNISAANASLGNFVTANFYAGNGYLLSGVNANTANYAGNVTVNAQPNITSVGTLTNLTVSGNVTATTFIGNLIGNIANANYAISSNYANYAGNVVNANQPNITTIGTLTALTVNGVTTLGPIGNFHLSGGSNGQVIKTDGNGTLTWQNDIGASAAGNTTEIQYNLDGQFNASPNFTYDNVTNQVNVTGDLVANAVTIGSGEYKFSRTSVYFATSVTTSETLLMTFPTANTAGLDFTIISTDPTAGNRQICKLEAVYYDSTVHYSEYNTIQVNGPVGNFVVTYEPGGGGSPPLASLYVYPTTSNMTTYKIQVTAYAE